MVLGSEIESGNWERPSEPQEGMTVAASPPWISPQHLSALLHEIRNPVATLRTLAKLLSKRLSPEDGHYWISRSIEQECHHLQDLLNHFEQELAAPVGIEPHPLDLICFIQEHHSTLAAIVQDHGLNFSLRWNESQDYPPVSADALALRQVLGNLVDNACKYTASGGDVWIYLERRDQRVVIEVCDTGIGINSEALEQIFNPFFRGTHDRPGQGLGLAISRDLIRQMGGDIEVESVPQRGSKFSVLLPLASPCQELTVPD